MKSKTRKTMIAAIVKESRLAQGYTQQELADKTGISLRSIQRIEGGEVEPRTFTLKLLAETLQIPVEKLLPAGPEPGKPGSTSTPKLILSAGLSLLIILLGMAYAAQATFPETHFEAFLGIAGLVGLITLLLGRLWPGKLKPLFSIGFILIAILLAFAFVAQSPSFPETGFEALLYMAGIVAFITAGLLLLWRKSHTNDLS